MIEFDKLHLADASIISLHSQGEGLLVAYRDWQEREHWLLFADAVGYQSFSPERRDLSHGTVEPVDDLILTACRAGDEPDSQSFRVFSFVSAWGEHAILRIVARHVSASSATLQTEQAQPS